MMMIYSNKYMVLGGALLVPAKPVGHVSKSNHIRKRYKITRTENITVGKHKDFMYS